MRQVVLALGLVVALVVPLGAAQAAELERWAEVDVAPGNITVSERGHVLISLHQFFEPNVRVAEVAADGRLTPFPNPLWARGVSQAGEGVDTVLGIQAAGDLVWMLDNGMRGGQTPRLVAWDLERDALAHAIELPPPATVEGSFVNDLAVDVEAGYVYIADPAGGSDAALIAVEIETGEARRLLQGHASVVPEDVDLLIEGEPVQVRRPDGSLQRPRVGVNPIALDADGEWVYFGPMHGLSLYRVRAADLRDTGLDDEALAERVERYADKPISDGISIDTAGNIYVTDLAGSAIGVIDAQRRYRVLAADARLLWPDALSYAPDGHMYVVANQLHRSARLNAGEDVSEPPFAIFRFRPLAEGMVGR
ncbi:hypothetical protein HUS23_12230 [Ectothiorhodospiraceae bacterium 2226]|nr:hypothetical protein HUS23_12230 [Ectothiorhodospiraceae bacterium 2226]